MRLLFGRRLLILRVIHPGIQPGDFFEDLDFWKLALRNYWSLLSYLIFSDHPKRPGIQPNDSFKDSDFWKLALRNYWSLLSPLIFSDHPKRQGDDDPLPPYNMVRNVMDMNAHYGGLSAALMKKGKLVWVMNVVPLGMHNTLPFIYDRGFSSVLHNW
ncbi:hypothetical protein FXO38_01860 [Capsicum annuum]|nr:hypothetical protein FXO37_34264 [Capsicum annuum]KAF3681202.1 hypothetical protein FXO38_01860 [Capsicum annuum]